jgi:D-aspartate ligase
LNIKSKNHVPAIVFGSGINGLGVIRNLGRNGIPVYCVVEKSSQVIHSKYCKKSYVIPNIENSIFLLRNFLANFENRESGAVLFPTSDLFSIHLSEIKDELENEYYPLVPNIEVARTLIEKKNFYKSISKYKIPYPQTFFPQVLADIPKICKEIKFPVFIKPCMSQIFFEKFSSKGFEANNVNELLKYFNLVLRHKIDVVVQEIIPGPASCVYGVAGYFDKNSCPKAFFGYHRLRAYPPVFGTSSLVESFSISNLNLIKNMVERYLHQLHGIMESEFKMDQRDGVLKLIEINARSWWQNSLPTQCGLNIVLMAYLDAIGEKIQYNEHYEEGIKWMYFMNDVASIVATRPSLKDWLHSIEKTRQFAYFAADDLVPLIASCNGILRNVLKKIRSEVIASSTSLEKHLT